MRIDGSQKSVETEVNRFSIRDQHRQSVVTVVENDEVNLGGMVDISTEPKLLMQPFGVDR